jgi:hypothetical protein
MSVTSPMTRPDRDALALLLAGLRKIGEPQNSQALTLFAARAGSLQRGELMVVGRAVNGGDICFKASELDERRQGELLDKLCAEAMPEGRDPLGWVGRGWGSKTEYNTRRSQFWRVIRAVSLALIPDASPVDWYSHIVWTNLYKVSPHQTGNPSGDLLRNQLPACVDLLSTEIEHWNPRRVLFLTGLEWARPFLSKLGCVVDAPGTGAIIEATTTLGGKDVIVAPHPQGKPERILARDIIARFQRGGG